MKITKLGHCCLVIKTNGVTILTDPGTYTTTQDNLTGIDVVLITHEHADHFHIESVKKILASNPAAHIITNSAVAKLLEAENISVEIVDQEAATEFRGIKIQAVGNDHAVIYQTLGLVQNTGYFIDNYLFYPGDALTDPKSEVTVLALPITGPWIKISEAIEYTKLLKPKKCFPVHDGSLKNPAVTTNTAVRALADTGIEFISLESEVETEL